ncbi:hypothetical protein Nepgr_025456 [Nepenthes gracilis]|uniref:Uncharacterized protein n=1 Tax=Nepenthes gracilis TaxID=150966 RepID=A0AAD3T4V0_NEPGR|nr:hypothetical protein Nepgr_025456 [Nepenthes gracilis]
MAWRCGSLSRSLIPTARSSSIRSSPPLTRLRSPPVSAPRLSHRRLSFAPSRNLGELGCTQSFLPLHVAIAIPRLTSHLSVEARACCELSHGKNGKDG